MKCFCFTIPRGSLLGLSFEWLFDHGHLLMFGAAVLSLQCQLQVREKPHLFLWRLLTSY